MNFIKNYLLILQEVRQIIQTCEEHGVDISIYATAKEIYQKAFNGLITSNYPYETTQDETLVIDICGEKYVCSKDDIATDVMQYENLKDKNVFVYIDEQTSEEVDTDDEYIMDVEDMTLSIDERLDETITHEQYSENIEPVVEEFEETIEEKVEETGVEEAVIPEKIEEEDSIDDVDFNENNFEEKGLYEIEMLPEDFEPEPEELEMEPEDFEPEPVEEDMFENQEMEEPKEVTEPESIIKEPVEETSNFEEDSEEERCVQEEEQEPSKKLMKYEKMPEHMHKDDFTFNFDRIYVSNEDESIKEKVRLLVMPMTIKDKYPEFLVCAIINKNTHMAISRNGETNIEVAGYKVTITGHMDGGLFVSRYILEPSAEENGFIIQTTSIHNGSKGHIIRDDEGIVIHILPAGRSNNKQGYAEFIYYINMNGKEQMGNNNNGKLATFMYEGKENVIEARWKNDILYSYVGPKR